MKSLNAFILCLLIFGSSHWGKAEGAKPNVLFIAIDDLNDWVGFMGGYPQARTPHMDALAKRGRNFLNAHCAVPVCSASRARVMSGVAASPPGCGGHTKEEEPEEEKEEEEKANAEE